MALLSRSSFMPFLFIVFFFQTVVSCDDAYYVLPQEITTIDDEEVISYPFLGSFSVKLFSNNSVNQQSAAAFQDYCVMVNQGRESLFLYNLATKQMLYRLKMEPGVGSDFTGQDLYHSSQTSFGVDFYDTQDVFPLLYISQRAREDRRCFVEVYRLIPIKSEDYSEYTSMEAFLVQTIYFPPMTMQNSMGNVNCVIDGERQLMYTYSRNRNTEDSNFGYCTISCFDIPDPKMGDVLLEDRDIKSSFMINCSAINMQGGCIHEGLLFIGQGYASVGYIYLNVIDLERKVLITRIDLLRNGITWEPEGCFFYENTLMMTTAGSDIWEFRFGESFSG